MAYKLLHSEEQLISFLQDYILKAAGNIVIQAGHFALVFDRIIGELVPAIEEGVEDEKVKKVVAQHPYMGKFPLITWETALKLISSNPDKQINLSIIVNDWQWVPKAPDGLLNDLRSNFYKKHTQLPTEFELRLTSYKLPKSIILPLTSDKKTLLYFGEQKLRNKAKREYKNISEKQRTMSCAYSYISFLDYVESNNTALLISFIPKPCKEPINFGTEVFMETHDSISNIKVVNIFCSGDNLSAFYEHTEIVRYP